MCDGPNCNEDGENLSSDATRWRCALCDYDLCNTCCYSVHHDAQTVGMNAGRGPVHQQAYPRAQLKCNRWDVDDTFVSLHNRVLPLMQYTEKLGNAYGLFEKLNAMYTSLHGVASSHAKYNQACCLSLGVSALLDEPSRLQWRRIAPGLPPLNLLPTIQDTAQARLKLAAAKLKAAVDFGYADVTSMRTDPDLKALRSMCPLAFEAALQQATANFHHQQARAMPTTHGVGSTALPKLL